MAVATADKPIAWPEAAQTRAPRLQPLARFVRSSPLGTIAAVFLIVLIMVALSAERLAPYDPLVADYSVSRSPPTAEHIFGADQLGRDTLSRMIFGARVSLFVALVSVLMGDSVGLVWGIAVAGGLSGRGAHVDRAGGKPVRRRRARLRRPQAAWSGRRPDVRIAGSAH
jgi:ABC-type dipeptide/oligopeptide/nickel transport system permease subunit